MCRLVLKIEIKIKSTMADAEDDMFFVVTSNAIPKDSLTTTLDPYDFKTYAEFCAQEIETLDLEGVPIRVEHLNKTDFEEDIAPFGSVVQTMRPGNGSLYVMSELHPIDPEERKTAAGKRRNDMRRGLIKLIQDGSFKDVSVCHKNEYDLDPVEKKIKCRKNITDVSFTTDPGRPGSNVVEYKFMPKSMRKTNEYRYPTSAFHLDVDRRQLAFIPKQVKANIKNFEEAERLFNNDISKQQKLHEINPNQKMSAPVASVSVTTPAVPTAAAPSAPVLPGTEAASAYLNRISELNEKNIEMQKKIEAMEKTHQDMLKIKDEVDKIRASKVAEVRDTILDGYSALTGNATSVLNSIKDVEPSAATEISKIEAESAKDIDTIKNGNLQLSDDNKTVSMDTQTLLASLRAQQNQVYANNMKSRIETYDRNRRILEAQNADIEKTLLGKRTAPDTVAAAPAAVPAASSTPSIAPPAATTGSGGVSVTPMGGNLSALIDGLKALPNPKRGRYEFSSK